MSYERGKVIRETKRRKFKGRAGQRPFISLPKVALNSIEFGSLSGHATKLLVELARQYHGKNNGDLSAAMAPLKNRGWRSPGTLNRAKKELVEAGFAIVTRQGGKNRCSLFALTFWAVDDCNGKHDERPGHAPLDLWKKER